MSSSTLCIYHQDADGQASAAIVRKKLGKDILLQGTNYGDPLPWPLINQADQVIIVDFSLPVVDMNRISKEKDLIWIDHHQSALREIGSNARDWKGLRDTSEAACVLTWNYFYPSLDLPRAVLLIGDRDIWRWEEKETGAFNEGLFHRKSNPENDSLWKPLLDGDQEALHEIIKEGKILYEARLENIKRNIDTYGYQVIFEGYQTLAINQRGNGDLGEEIRKRGYEIGYCYIDNLQNGDLVTKVTLFSDQVDVSVIAQKFGGGGHPGASGFQFPHRDPPFPAQVDVEILNDKNSSEEES